MYPIKITKDMTTQEVLAACKNNREFVESYYPENPTPEEIQDARDVEETNNSLIRGLR